MLNIRDLHRDTVGIRDQHYFALQERTGIYKGSALSLTEQDWRKGRNTKSKKKKDGGQGFSTKAEWSNLGRDQQGGKN